MHKTGIDIRIDGVARLEDTFHALQLSLGLFELVGFAAKQQEYACQILYRDAFDQIVAAPGLHKNSGR